MPASSASSCPTGSAAGGSRLVTRLHRGGRVAAPAERRDRAEEHQCRASASHAPHPAHGSRVPHRTHRGDSQGSQRDPQQRRVQRNGAASVTYSPSGAQSVDPHPALAHPIPNSATCTTQAAAVRPATTTAGRRPSRPARMRRQHHQQERGDPDDREEVVAEIRQIHPAEPGIHHRIHRWDPNPDPRAGGGETDRQRPLPADKRTGQPQQRCDQDDRWQRESRGSRHRTRPASDAALAARDSAASNRKLIASREHFRLLLLRARERVARERRTGSRSPAAAGPTTAAPPPRPRRCHADTACDPTHGRPSAATTATPESARMAASAPPLRAPIQDPPQIADRAAARCSIRIVRPSRASMKTCIDSTSLSGSRPRAAAPAPAGANEIGRPTAQPDEMGAASPRVSPDPMTRNPTNPVPDSPANLPDPPKDWLEVYRRLVLRELAFDFRVGFAIEYYRTFSTPSMARVLAPTVRCSATRRSAATTPR